MISKSPVVFFIGFVFPEPQSSAAGSRIIQLINFFKTQGFTVVFGSAANRSEHSFDLKSIGVVEEQLNLNSNCFDDFILKLNPGIVVFDRFMTEEQFGWRVADFCPKAIRILDTEDLHFLRKARKDNKNGSTVFSKEYLKTDTAKRELASIYRSDLSLIISEIEMDILIKQLNIPPDLLIYIPFLLDNHSIPDQLNSPKFSKRNDFVFVGNFLHPPNADAVLFLKTKIWPHIHKKLPQASLHIYGAYPKQKHLNLQSKRNNFFVHGHVDDIDYVLSSSKVLLAPLQFGAGLKGKVVDALRNGTPCVLSSIAAEGIFGTDSPNGYVIDDERLFVEYSIELYTNKTLWETSHYNGFEILEKRFGCAKFYSSMLFKIREIQTHLEEHRLKNLTGMLLQHHGIQSTKYFSKWIEAKNN